MKTNPKRFQFMILGRSTRQSIILNINEIKIRESSSEVLLGLWTDNRFTFKDHINPFVPYPPFLYPLKTSENRKVFWYFQGVEKRYIGNEWVNILCRRTSSELHELRRLRKYLTIDKVKLLYDAFTINNCASIIWMFCHTNDYSRIEKTIIKP